MNNIIILTHGWAGSSVFAGLLGRAGFWLGESTARKHDYDTFENHELVRLNERWLATMAPDLRYEQQQFDAATLARFSPLPAGDERNQALAFVRHCNMHEPWVWKDPRLTWTLRVWAPLLDLSNVSFLLLTREPTQAWISANLRRHIQSWHFRRDYGESITQANLAYVASIARPHLALNFEELLLQPESTLARMNRVFGTQLELADLQAVCKEPLYRRTRGWVDGVKAALIYGKNFRLRDGRGVGSRSRSDNGG